MWVQLQLAIWFPVDYGSIYAVLGALERQGHIQALEVEREGSRPERTRFAITRGGRCHLEDLLKGAWRHIGTAADPVQAALLVSDELEQADIDRLLQMRLDDLQVRLREIQTMGRSAPNPALVERQRVLTEAKIVSTRDQLHQREQPHRR